MKNKIFAAFCVFAVFLSAEFFLRAQQALGPLYDLDCLREITDSEISDTLNHKPRLKNKIKVFIEEERQIVLIKNYDADGIRINPLRPSYPRDSGVFKVLFMGDSFMEGLDDAHTIPQYIWEDLQRSSLRDAGVSLINSGFSSYSPSIFIVQAKKLIPMIKPDILVIDIDQTDIQDDYLRYRNLITRDGSGRISAVRCSPLIAANVEGFRRIRRQPLYLTRLFTKIYHTMVFMPRLMRKEGAAQREVLLSTPDADIRVFFRSNIEELAETLIDLMQDRAKILFIYHSYFAQIKGDESDTVVADTLREVLHKYGVSFYDATRDLKRIFKDDADSYYMARDKGKHFNFKGLKVYSSLVFKKLFPLMKELFYKAPSLYYNKPTNGKDAEEDWLR